MAVLLETRARRDLRELRVATSPWHVRGIAGSHTVVDSRRVRLVWEPRRVTPVYAVPEGDVRGTVEAAGPPRPLTGAESGRPVLDPTVAFDAHTAAGETVRIRTGNGDAVAAFRIHDEALAGFVTIDFDALTWFEEGSEQPAHPRDPFHRIDVHPTRQHVVMSLDGEVVVDTDRARLLAETMLPVRWYLPADAVRVPLEASETSTACAYKGRATYGSARVRDRLLEDLFWTYEHPLSDGRDVQGLLGVYAERLDVVVDGVAQPRPGPFRG
ncbi:DUF427 domain-containing protein [Amnibacterium sp.]|uniref:DUF427 domain-containing protein n=1 Tax=Amnibacterium sp. TaxID=1872496 RepID=UPI0026386FB4|nr:DUF427 domain-containing protein [Amnibacterium sp.]MCU1473239.1 hypothetical protein [Amnibacterium sp.]